MGDFLRTSSSLPLGDLGILLQPIERLFVFLNEVEIDSGATNPPFLVDALRLHPESHLVCSICFLSLACLFPSQVLSPDQVSAAQIRVMALRGGSIPLLK